MPQQSSIWVPVTEQLINRLNLPAGTHIFRAESELWAYYDNLIATLFGTPSGTGVGDTLDVTLETVGPSGMLITIATFTQVLGNSVLDTVLQQARVMQKTSSVSWYNRIQARAVVAGGTAAFDFKLSVQGS